MDAATNNSKLPQNLDVEASLLGSVLIDDEALVKIGDVVSGDDFFDQRH